MTDTVKENRDVINAILGIEDDSPIAAIRKQFPQNAIDFQAYYDALFRPAESSLANLSLAYRFPIAIRVATHTGSAAVADWYKAEAREAGVSDKLIAKAEDLTTTDTDDEILSAAFAHTDLLTTHPVDARREALDDLSVAGFPPAAIVTLSQVVAFVSYQLRFVALIRAVGELQ